MNKWMKNLILAEQSIDASKRRRVHQTVEEWSNSSQWADGWLAQGDRTADEFIEVILLQFFQLKRFIKPYSLKPLAKRIASERSSCVASADRPSSRTLPRLHAVKNYGELEILDRELFINLVAFLLLTKAFIPVWSNLRAASQFIQRHSVNR